MKSVLISIRPKWCELIANGKKTIEVRKSAPKIEAPFKVYIYCTQYKPVDYINYGYGLNMSAGMVIGEFVCDCMTPLYNVCYDDWNRLLGGMHEIEKQFVKNACLTEAELHKYANKKQCFAWHISNLKIFDKEKNIREFISPTKAKNCVDYCLNGICSNLGYEELCGAIRRCEYKKLSRPPQSWCYVEEEKSNPN